MLEITVDALTKDFGSIRAVDNVSFEVRPGRVVGFIGPNGSGKTTTLRMLLGLVTPTSGEARIGGRRFVDLEDPARQVGAVLEARAFHPGRTARDHLRVIATEARISSGTRILAWMISRYVRPSTASSTCPITRYPTFE